MEKKSLLVVSTFLNEFGYSSSYHKQLEEFFLKTVNRIEIGTDPRLVNMNLPAGKKKWVMEFSKFKKTEDR